jgi:TIR domain-containing protein
MADVFISYSKSRRALTQSLARHLEAEGFSVWWDTDLLPADNFRAEIDRQLEMATAVIIVWTPESIKSEWVCAEADRAHEQSKLINSHAPGVSPRRIPIPFNQTHSVPVDNRASIVAAIRRLREQRSSEPTPVPPTDPSPVVTVLTDRAERTQEFIWRPQHAAHYTTFGVVKFGDPVIVKVAPVTTTDDTGATVFQKGVVVRVR